MLAFVAVAVIAGFPTRSFAQQPTLADVLSKAAASVAAFADTTRVIACEERYKQNFNRRRIVLADAELYQLRSSQNDIVGVDSREWVAELVLAATPANAPLGLPWMEFRDILSVRGKPLREGTSRLGMLATRPMEAAGPEAIAITRDAAGFMLGRFVRAIDLPRLALVFLHTANQPRFEFSKGGNRTIDGVKTLEVKYRENATPSIIRGSGDKEAPSTGSFWIDPATGRVLMSLLKSADSSTIYDQLTVTYRPDSATGLCLPVELKEKIVDADAGQSVEATATFTNWRIVPRKSGTVPAPGR